MARCPRAARGRARGRARPLPLAARDADDAVPRQDGALTASRGVAVMRGVARAGLAGLGAVAAVAARDLVQREHTLLRNFPVLGHARYLLESIGPELRQYLVAGDNEERPFTRAQRAR